ncbi:MAG: hypothetical protein KF834_02700 [Burkholderiales bacterium]|nr:hypothetical protein [Burkholderiales bacterium]
MNRLRALLVAVLLLALPVQGLAAYTPAMTCGDAQAMHGDSDNRQHGHHVPAKTAMDHHHQDNSNSAEPSGGHSCCHHVVAGAPALIAGIAETPRVLVSRITSLATLYIPEMPQRPPRA